MKHILIPTDFTIRPLKLINAAIGQFEGEPITIYLVHALEPDDSISGLLFPRKRLHAHTLYDDTFLQACEMLKNKYGAAIRKINIEFYTGSTRFYRRNFLHARNIDAVLLPDDYHFKACSQHSVDPETLWNGNEAPVLRASIMDLQPDSPVMDHSVAGLLSV